MLTMALPVNTNIASLNAQRNLQGSTLKLNQALERLSSGLRINSAGDDAAGLAISEGLRSQIRGLNQAVRNAGDGLSLIGTAESAIGSYTEMLQRIRELAIQSANDTNSVANRTALDQEVQQLLEEMQRIATTVEFNGTKLLDGSFVAKQLQVGAQAGQTITVNTGSLQTSVIGQTAQKLGVAVNLAANPTDVDLAINGVFITGFPTYVDTVSSANNIRSAITIAAAINAKTNQHNTTAAVEAAELSPAQTIAGGAIDPGTVQLTINGVDIFDSITTVLADDADGSLRDAINQKSNQTGVTASLNSSNQLTLTAADGRNIIVGSTGTIGDELGFTAGDSAISASVGGKIRLKSNNDITVSGATPALAGFTATTYFKDPNLAINTATVATVAGANLTIEQVDNALEQVNDIRAKLGATINRLERTIGSLQAVSENLAASDSRIRDADFAAETANLTKNQILQQAGIAILGQANTTTQSALQLLQR
jgi:flagellin